VLDEQIARAKALLGEATKATGIVNARALVKAAPGMEDINAQGQDYVKATVLVRQAAAELAAAKQLATDLAGANAAKKKGDEAMVPAAFPVALQALGKEVSAALAAPHSDLFPDLYTTMDTALLEAGKRIEAKDLEGAGAQLKLLGEALVKARMAQSEHDRFKKTYDPLALQLTALTTSTVPLAAKIKDKTDPFAAAMRTAGEQDTARDWTKAFQALNTAGIAAEEAKAAADARKAHDTAQKLLTDKANTLTDPVKSQILGMIAKADTAADAFNFAHAQRFLDNAQARMEGEAVKTLAKATPLDIGKIEAMVEKMLQATGGEELLARPTDSVVQPRNPQQAGQRIPARGEKTPNGPELLDQIVKGFDDSVPVEVIAAIAAKRFGITLSVSALIATDLPGDKMLVKDEVPTGGATEEPGNADFTRRSQTARKLYETLAMTPEQATRNPSLRAVTRLAALKITVDDSDGSFVSMQVESGGWYEASTNKSVMKGRPGDVEFNQDFGRDCMANDGTGKMLPEPPPQPWDEKTTKEQKELEVYEPATGGALDYFEFANVHETGHGVDDRLGFMNARLGQAAFGGWLNHGSNVAAVAQPVASHYAKANGVADQAGSIEPYARDMILGGSPAIPVVDPEKQPGVNAACEAIRTEWYPNANEGGTPWWSQSKCDKITMDDGRIYQQAYANTWVSYPAAERKKGVTGYQFRAPGEWFAELFAAYHNGKLKSGHPARKWLSSLQL
jgi:hypothetical protein